MRTEQLIKYIEGNSTREEKETIAKWLDSDKKNRDEFILLRKSYDFTLFNLQENIRDEKTVKEKRTIIYELLKITAVILLSFSLYYLIDKVKENSEDETVMHTLHVPAGQRAELTLADGTNVWLNAKTKLTFPNRFSKSNREVKLDGEAYFTVRHDPENQFMVNTGSYAIKVLGTEFNVAAYQSNNTFETALLKGSVEISSLQSDEKIKLLPDYMAYLKDGKLIQRRIYDYEHFLWRKGLICFVNERMETIIAKLQLYYDVKIQVENREILKYPYTGKFWTKDGIEHVIKVLKIHADFEYEKDNENNVITIY